MTGRVRLIVLVGSLIVVSLGVILATWVGSGRSAGTIAPTVRQMKPGARR